MQQVTLAQAIDVIPGNVKRAAEVCGVSTRAVYKWLKAGRLPRTDYTGETRYAYKLADEASGQFTAEQLLHPVSDSPTP